MLRAFDVLFRKALREDPALAEPLRAAGFDPDAPAPEYPSSVWIACLETARRHLFPDLPQAQGMRALGERFADGLNASTVGQVYDGIRFTAEAYLLRLPRLLQLARPDLVLEPFCEGERRWRFVISGPSSSPDFMAGLVQARLRERGMPATVEVLTARDDGYELGIRW